MTSQVGLVSSPSRPGLETLSDSSPRPLSHHLPLLPPPSPPLGPTVRFQLELRVVSPHLSPCPKSPLRINLCPGCPFSCPQAFLVPCPGRGPRHLLLWERDVGTVQKFLSPEHWATLAKSLYLSGLCHLLSKMRHRKAIEAGGATAWTR